MTVYGDGSQTRSLCYVDDLIEGLMRLLYSDYARPVNLGNLHEVTVLELAAMVRDICDSGSAIEMRPLPVDDPQRRCPDVSVALRELDWRATIPLDDGLRRTVDWGAALACDPSRRLRYVRQRVVGRAATAPLATRSARDAGALPASVAHGAILELVPLGNVEEATLTFLSTVIGPGMAMTPGMPCVSRVRVSATECSAGAGPAHPARLDAWQQRHMHQLAVLRFAKHRKFENWIDFARTLRSYLSGVQRIAGG